MTIFIVFLALLFFNYFLKLLQVIIAVLSLILVRAIKKEEESITFKR